MRHRILIVATLFLVFSATAQEAPAPLPPSDEFTKLVFFGSRFFEGNDFAGAYEQFAAADALRLDQPAVIYNLALLLAKLGRFSDAQVKVDRYVELFPTGAERRLVNELQLLLEFQRELQRRRQAEQEYTDLFTRGRFHYSRNELAAALALFDEAERKRPGDAAAVYNQAVVNERLGELAKAVERYHRFLDIAPDDPQKHDVDQKIVALESEIGDMETKIVCSFCGHRLHATATWCHRCWRGPYAVTGSAAQACETGASITRSSYFQGDRFFRNEQLECPIEGNPREVLRYSPARQKAIQEARKSEGWTYDGEVIKGWRDRSGNELLYAQGSGYLERIAAPGTGEILDFEAHRSGDLWLLDSEEWIIDGTRFRSRYRFDAENRIVRQVVDYRNTSACNHLISMAADYLWSGSQLAGGTIRGDYDGFPTEGSPKVEWQVALVNTHDERGRLTREELNVTSFTKTYTARPAGAERKEIASYYPAMRVKRPMTDMVRTGDICGMADGRYLSNAIDLRPFTALTRNLSMVVPNGVVRATVTIAK